LFQNIKDHREFRRRVDILWEGDYEEFELEAFPSTTFGGFAPSRVREFLRLAKMHPEFHIVSCIEPDLLVNSFVSGAMLYYLAQGDPDSNLVHDLHQKLDAHFIQSLNSGRKIPSP